MRSLRSASARSCLGLLQEARGRKEALSCCLWCCRLGRQRPARPPQPCALSKAPLSPSIPTSMEPVLGSAPLSPKCASRLGGLGSRLASCSKKLHVRPHNASEAVARWAALKAPAPRRPAARGRLPRGESWGQRFRRRAAEALGAARGAGRGGAVVGRQRRLHDRLPLTRLSEQGIRAGAAGARLCPCAPPFPLRELELPRSPGRPAQRGHNSRRPVPGARPAPCIGPARPGAMSLLRQQTSGGAPGGASARAGRAGEGRGRRPAAASAGARARGPGRRPGRAGSGAAPAGRAHLSGR